ncbi:hypothetical protein BaRGS_00026936 [Batillaria attramentaria]|uniref:Uncharacterized protein n=1 Tax=Batillaria attramentaria TaxID=370345 RepID=A0ABD0K3E9_9CAEN
MWGDTNCSQPCGNCAANSSCDMMSGNCTHGCREGWTGIRCAEKHKDANLVVPVVGAILGAGVLIAICVLAAVFVRRSRRKEKERAGTSADTTQETTFGATHPANVSSRDAPQQTATENLYAQLQNDENTRDYTRLEFAASSTHGQDNLYEKLGAQYYNAGDVNPYEALSLSPGRRGGQVASNPPANRNSAVYANTSGNNEEHVYANTSFPLRK